MNLTDPYRTVWALVPAGGQGERFGGEILKQLILIDGRPVLAWTLERLLACGLAGLTVALPEDRLQSTAELIPVDDRVTWVAGGASRQLSVAACLNHCPAEIPWVLVHDGARPAVAVADVRATIDAVGDADGAILGRPVGDTIKRVEQERVVETVDRNALFRAETPQVFKRSILERALTQSEAEGYLGTDEASIVERLEGVSIRTVVASRPNPKLTRPEDLPWVQMLLEERKP